jgi:hypothetical protein
LVFTHVSPDSATRPNLLNDIQNRVDNHPVAQSTVIADIGGQKSGHGFFNGKLSTAIFSDGKTGLIDHVR